MLAGTVASYEPNIPDFAQCRVLDDISRLEPVTELQDLIDLAFHCAEIVEDVDEIERLLDGISRLADQRPSDFQDRVDPADSPHEQERLRLQRSGDSFSRCRRDHAGSRADLGHG